MKNKNYKNKIHLCLKTTDLGDDHHSLGQGERSSTFSLPTCQPHLLPLHPSLSSAHTGLFPHFLCVSLCPAWDAPLAPHSLVKTSHLSNPSRSRPTEVEGRQLFVPRFLRVLMAILGVHFNSHFLHLLWLPLKESPETLFSPIFI